MYPLQGDSLSLVADDWCRDKIHPGAYSVTVGSRGPAPCGASACLGKYICWVEPGDKVEVAGSIRYPDAFMLCSPMPGTATVTNQLIVVFEILSPSTSRTDRIVKAREYGNTESIQRYVILEQTSQAATVFTHINGLWASVIVEGDADLPMPEIGITVPLAELYLDVPFPPEAESAAG
jgi:Uma2 family endonuclease